MWDQKLQQVFAMLPFGLDTHFGLTTHLLPVNDTSLEISLNSTVSYVNSLLLLWKSRSWF